MDSAPAASLKAPDAQFARTAGAAELASVEAIRTNASDGSLRQFSAETIAAQEHSIELVYGDRVASRTEKKSEMELLRERANKPENIDTNGLESVANDTTLPEEKRALAGMLQEMRAQSKAHGITTGPLDEYAREALKEELAASSQNTATNGYPKEVEQEECGSFYYPQKNLVSRWSSLEVLSLKIIQGKCRDTRLQMVG